MKSEACKNNIAGKMAEAFINHPLTFILSLLIIAIGYFTLQISPREANPQIVVSGGVVIVAYPGVKAAAIQKLIVEPLQRRLQEVDGVEDIYGIAKDNIAILNVKFFLGENKEQANFRLYNSVFRNLDVLPKGCLLPIVKTMDIDTDIAIASIAFYPKEPSLSLRVLHKEVAKIQTKINRIKNVAITKLIGVHNTQYNIKVDLHKLSGYHISLIQVIQAVESLSAKTSDIAGKSTSNKIVFFGVEKAIENVQDIQNLIVSTYGGAPVYIKDIAIVTKGEDIQNKKRASISFVENGSENELEQITLSISKKKGANVVDVTSDVFTLMEQIRGELEKKKIGFIITRDDGYTADHSVNELVEHIVISILIIAVLLVFTLGVKEAIIVTLTVPMIISVTLFSGYILGQSINKISLFALLLSLGLLVDSAIIVIENIHRHSHNHDARQKTLKEIAVTATNEVGNPTNLATIAIVITFLTMFLVSGTVGQYIRPIAIYAPIAMVSSLFVAYVFTPYFVKMFMGKGE